jgi:hypothetical protein
MGQEDKPELVDAKLTRVSWWRAALGRLGVGRDRGYRETLDRYAARDVNDTLGEEDLQSWLAMLGGESQGRAPKPPGAPRKS